MVDKVNGKINAIHDDSLELTEFTGCFGTFNLENLEMRVHTLAGKNKDEEDLSEPQHTSQAQDSDSNLESHSIEDMTGIGFDPNNYSPIPSFGSAALQHQRAVLPTLTPKPVGGANLNILDPTHNRGRANIIINSFTNNQEQVETQKESSKGGKVKSSQVKSQHQPCTSTQVPTGNTGRLQVQCTTCGGSDHLRKDCCEDVFCTQCRPKSHTTEMCLQNQVGMMLYVFIVAV